MKSLIIFTHLIRNGGSSFYKIRPRNKSSLTFFKIISHEETYGYVPQIGRSTRFTHVRTIQTFLPRSLVKPKQKPKPKPKACISIKYLIVLLLERKKKMPFLSWFRRNEKISHTILGQKTPTIEWRNSEASFDIYKNWYKGIYLVAFWTFQFRRFLLQLRLTSDASYHVTCPQATIGVLVSSRWSHFITFSNSVCDIYIYIYICHCQANKIYIY